MTLAWSPQMLSLHLLVERAKGSDSFWAPFIARLPSQVRPCAWVSELAQYGCPERRRLWFARDTARGHQSHCINTPAVAQPVKKHARSPAARLVD